MVGKYFLNKYIKKHTSLLILGGISILILSLLLLPTPFLTRHIIDNVLPNKNLEKLIIFISVVLIILLLQKILGYFQNFLFYKINNKIIYDIKLDLLKKINSISLKISKQFGTGYLISRINSDTQRLRSLFADTMIHIVKDVFTFIVGFCAIFYIHWKLAIVSVVLLPFFAVTTIYFSKKIRSISKIYFEDDSQTVKQLDETLSMIELIKQYSRQKFNILRYISKANISYKSYVKLGKISFTNNLVIGLIGGLAPIIIIGYGGYEIINERLTIGSLIAFNSFVGYLFGPTNRLVNVNVQIQQALVALNRIKELFDMESEPIKEIENFSNIENISFNNVNFNYEENEKLIDKLSFKIYKGEKVAIVGGSGNGKTTIFRLLTGLYDIDSGEIRINNRTASYPEIVFLRKKIAVVEQEPFMFDDTIYNNIALGKAGATKEEIYNVAENAYVNNFADKMVDGLLTQVGIKGSNLSVGQKQRISIARALLKSPDVLLMDEATSNIDTISEKYIEKTISAIGKDKIVIIVAHRLSTIRNCDKIFVLENGTIKESGTHDELMCNESVYYQLNCA
ncbi:MAG: ABC transporter ATP-binding protein [Candidatus Delongbacteria bacterium]|jgi:ABC-type bacteriocin/lantibiotic exporter with double-glycine peptidase domain|nr:ABC transporter ATP-binding protein [Candidatus Delongbacteria bacterium]